MICNKKTSDAELMIHDGSWDPFRTYLCHNHRCMKRAEHEGTHECHNCGIEWEYCSTCKGAKSKGYKKNPHGKHQAQVTKWTEEGLQRAKKRGPLTQDQLDKMIEPYTKPSNGVLLERAVDKIKDKEIAIKLGLDDIDEMFQKFEEDLKSGKIPKCSECGNLVIGGLKYEKSTT